MRNSRLVRGLLDWVTGGVSARLDFVERDLHALQDETKQVAARQRTMARAIVSHEGRLNQQTSRMIALRRMHGTLAARLGQPFPGKTCPDCGGAMIFERAAAEKAYSLECERRCGERLLLGETHLLETFSAGAND